MQSSANSLEPAVIFRRFVLPWAQYTRSDTRVCEHRAAHWPSSYSLVVSRAHSPSEVKVELLIKNSCRAVACKHLQKSQVTYA